MSDLNAAIAQVRKASETLDASGRPFPLPIGDLAPLVAGTVSALERCDWWVPSLRERAGAVLRDVRVETLTDAFSGSRPYKVAPPSTGPALGALTGVGLALALDQGVAVVHLGVGSIADGAFHEALNLAALTDAPVVFVVAQRDLDDGAPVGPQTAADPIALAGAFGVTTSTVDAHDASAVHAAIRVARQATPHLVCATL